MGIADEQYVSLTTFRKSGEGVPTPVWAVPLAGGRIGVWTAPDAWKVKRIRNNPAVELTACDFRGGLTTGAPTVPGTAAVFTSGPEVDQVRAALHSKYGIKARLGGWGSALKAKFKGTGSYTVIVISPAS